MIGVSEDDPNRVYVVSSNSGSFGHFYVSTNSGTTFTEKDHSGRNYFGYDTAGINSGGQAPRDMDVAVNPENADEVFIAGILTWRSTDSGSTFEPTADWVPVDPNGPIGYHHADVDILLFNGTTLFVGSDGGIYKAEDTAAMNADYYEDITDGIGIRQWYKIGVSQTPNALITGGSQDNGSSFYNTSEDLWIDWIGADGMEGFIDKDDPNLMYGMIQNGGMYRTDDAANSLENLNNPDYGNWVSPFEQDPQESGVIYAGFDRVYRSVNKGNSWNSVSQVFGANLDHLKIADSNNNIMYAAVGGDLYITEDGGATNWQLVRSMQPRINSIAIHPSKPYTVAIALTNSDKVLVSDDGGETWENYGLNLPDFSAISLVWHDNGASGLYVGMNYGIYYIDDDLSEWQPFSNNLPNVIINELEIHVANEELYAASYGRGLWVSPTAEASGTLGVSGVALEDEIVLYPNPAKDLVNIRTASPLTTAIKIYDTAGKLVVFQKDVEILGSVNLDISTLQDGMYFVRFNSEKGTATKKLLIK